MENENSIGSIIFAFLIILLFIVILVKIGKSKKTMKEEQKEEKDALHFILLWGGFVLFEWVFKFVFLPAKSGIRVLSQQGEPLPDIISKELYENDFHEILLLQFFIFGAMVMAYIFLTIMKRYKS